MALRFIDWKRAFLPSIVEELITPQVLADRSLDLGNDFIVLPGARAGRRLLELLTIACQEASICFSPPRIITPSQFLEWLMGECLTEGQYSLHEDPQVSLASDHDLLVAWHSVLSKLSPETRSLIIAKEADSSLLWSDAAVFVTLQRELLGGGYSFSDVSETLADSLSPTVGQQWSLLSDLEQLVDTELATLNLLSRTKLIKELANRSQLVVKKRCIVAAVVDAQPLFFKLLGKLTPTPEIYCFCSKAHSDRFDEFGRLQIEAWATISLPILDSQISSLATPRLEAQSVALKLIELSQKSSLYSNDKHPDLASTVTICAADQAFMPLLSTELKRWKISAHFNPGWSLADSTLIGLISIIANYAAERSFDSLSKLVRHPEFSRFIANSAPYPDYHHDLFLNRLDRYISERIPLTTKTPITDSKVASTVSKIEELLGDLIEYKLCSATEWCLRVERIIKSVFGQTDFQINIPSQRAVAESCIALFELLRAVVNSKFASAQPINFVEFSSLLKFAAQGVPYSPYREEQDSIEIVGWLDLLLDDAPRAIITALHEGAIPEMMTSNELLPNSAKRQLGLPSNESRLARDVYIALASINCKDSVSFSFHRQSLDHAPMQPSSLLLRPGEMTPSGSSTFPLWSRVRQLLDLPKLANSPVSITSPIEIADDELPQIINVLGGNKALQTAAPAFVRPIAIPSPVQDPPDKLSPSAITAYLQCPYRFYLAHVLELEEQADSNTEIPSHIIGSIIHKVLEQLPNEGRFNLEATSKRIIYDWYERIDQHFGDTSRNILTLLKAEGAKRLEKTVDWFYQRRLSGWIRHGVEHKLSIGPSPETHGFIINGRVDALEYNPNTNEALIIDYKLRERTENPTNALGSDGQWRSLTLPIYYHLALKELNEVHPNLSSLQIAFLNLGPEHEYELKFAKWSDEQLESAWRLTLELLGKIRAKLFWPPSGDEMIFDPYQKLVGDLAGLYSEDTMSVEE